MKPIDNTEPGQVRRRRQGVRLHSAIGRMIIAGLLLCVTGSVRSDPVPGAAPVGAGPLPSKKGICLITGREHADTWRARVAALNVSWHYSWGASLPQPEPASVEFVPMLWGYWGTTPSFLKCIEDLASNATGRAETHLLGFNEPDGRDQANMSVERALEAWPYLQKTGLRLGSPGAVHADKEWMQAFMAQASQRGYRVDFVCVHWYGAPDAAGFLSYLRKVHDQYGKPLWITEFAPADWKATSRDANRLAPERVRQFMRQVLPQLDALDFVERYAWFPATEDNKALGPSALFKADGALTELGRIYASHGQEASRKGASHE